MPVVLCGGSGIRLWPLSRKSFPKQFVPLVGGRSLLQLTLERVAALSSRVIAVAAEEHRFLVAVAPLAAEGHDGHCRMVFHHRVVDALGAARLELRAPGAHGGRPWRSVCRAFSVSVN